MICAFRNLLTFTSGKLKRFVKDERGDSNIVAIILIIVVVIALVAIFRERMSAIIGTVMDKIEAQVA